jgi:uncharacterized membrane protein
MDKLLFSVITGAIVAILDIIPLIFKKIPRYLTIASFIHFFFVSIVILNIDIPYVAWWLEGGLIGIVLMIPMLICVGNSDKKPLPIIAFKAVFFGTITAIIGHYLY